MAEGNNVCHSRTPGSQMIKVTFSPRCIREATFTRTSERETLAALENLLHFTCHYTSMEEKEKEREREREREREGWSVRGKNERQI